MHEMHIKAHYIKPWTKTTVSKNFSNRLRNILKRDFDPASPDAAWCTDITYIWTYDDGFVYLTSVMDLFSRKIISWVLTKDMTAESVLEAIKIAQKRRNIRKPVIIHSDRGIQFTGELYKEITEKMKRSYSKKACPWDNACIESFHSLIKRSDNMSTLPNDKIEKYLDELSDEYKNLLYKALVARTKPLDDLSVSELLRMDSEIKKPLLADYKNKQRRDYTLFRLGLLYMILGAFIFLLSILFWKNDQNGVGNIISLISCIVAFIGFIFVLYSFATQIFGVGTSKYNASSEEYSKVLEYEIVMKWRELEGIVEDISITSQINTSNSVIQFLAENHFIDNNEFNILREFLKMRNNIVYATDVKYTTEELKQMLSEINLIINKLEEII